MQNIDLDVYRNTCKETYEIEIEIGRKRERKRGDGEFRSESIGVYA